MTGEARPRVVIVGGGFAGLAAARSLAQAPADLTLVDRRNHHVFQPLLYQVAMAGLGAPEIAAPIRHILRRQRHTSVLLGEVTDLDLAARTVRVDAARDLTYDYLVLATGARHSYFGHPEWESVAPGLKTLEDALEIRRRVLTAFERAEAETDPERRRAWLTFAVVGAGATGVELAGSIAEMGRYTLAAEFRNIDARSVRVLLLEGTDRVLPPYPPDMSWSAREQLETLGVQVLTGARVTGIDADGVALGAERIPARTVLWAAGIEASPLGRALGAVDRVGRVPVGPDLSVPGHPEVFAVGDLAAFAQGGAPVPGVAPAAMQMGRHAGEAILCRLAGKPAPPFRYVDKGSLATIGRRRAVAVVGPLRLSGFPAWVAWLGIHVFFLIGFRNRLVVMLEWALAWLTYERSARIILDQGGRAGGAST